MPRNRQAYLKQVAKFINTNGPQFTLDEMVKGQTRACQCCGYYPIVKHYHVRGEANNEAFVIGSECQTWVLTYTDAHLPASRVRKLDPSQLVQLGDKYGVTLNESLGQVELAKQVISARRRYANTAGWVSRRAQGKAPAVKEVVIKETN